MVWMSNILSRSLSKALGDCGGREHWGGDVNYDMYKERRAEEISCCIGSQWNLN